MPKQDKEKREYNREYKRKRRLDPKFKAKERKVQMLAWRRKNEYKAKRLARAQRNEAIQGLRNAGMGCPKIAAVLGVSLNTVLRNSSRATPEDKG